MSIGPSRWYQRRHAAQMARRQPTVNTCEVRPRAVGAGYKVTITGTNLVAPGVTTAVRVGDQQVTRARIDPRATITGNLDERPHDGDEAVVTVGADQTRTRVSMVTTPAVPQLDDLRDMVAGWWKTLHRRMRDR